MIRWHAYYLPAEDRVHGSGSAELAEALRLAWARHALGRPHPYDGVSIWCTEQGAIVVRVCRTRTTDEGLSIVDVLDATGELSAGPARASADHAQP